MEPIIILTNNGDSFNYFDGGIRVEREWEPSEKKHFYGVYFEITATGKRLCLLYDHDVKLISMIVRELHKEVSRCCLNTKGSEREYRLCISLAAMESQARAALLEEREQAANKPAPNGAEKNGGM